MKYDVYAIMSYETFLLGQFQISTNGLFYSGGRYYIYCPEITENTLATDGQNIHEWFLDHKIMGTQILLTNKLPENAVQIDGEIASSKALEAGYLVTQSDVEYEIQLLIPKMYPDYEILNTRPISVSFFEDVSGEGFDNLKNIFKEAKFQVPVNFVNGTKPEKKPESQLNFIQNVITAHDAKRILSSELTLAWEEDEDKWMDTRHKILTSNPDDSQQYKSESLRAKQFRCLIDCSSGFADNIRNYLTMYDQICLVAQYTKNQEQAFEQLGLSKDEFLKLHELNKLQVLFPKSIENYDQSLLQDLLSIKKSNVHLSRSVTTMTVSEMRRRNPFLFPAISIEEKQLLLSSVDKSIPSLTQNPKLAQAIRETITDTGNGWVRFPNMMNQQDSIILSSFGTMNLVRPMLETYTNRDFKLDFMMSAPAVEWAAGTGSILIPSTVHGYDTTAVSSLIADLYSGTPSEDWVMQKRDYANFTADNILAINGYLPVVELATTFNSVETARFRKLVLDISKHQGTLEEVAETVEAYNHFVKQYEKNKDHLSAWNIKGFIIGLLGKATDIPMASWLMGHALKYAIKISGNNPSLIKVIETIEAGLQGSVPDAVLLSKMRDKVKKKL
ncbi:hypothetical protein AAFN85_13610 [Mucilaginibacter sp. CAU 1740]|uniref:hypothetical protein n=1 Tax=Mucilaginibacter sp. CAU 1740 TaxID=3140365 RepID=UPI00325AEF92